MGESHSLNVQQEEDEEAMMTTSSYHTECFMCGRIYFDRVLQKCPECGSVSLRHYTTEELDFFLHRAVAGQHPAIQVLAWRPAQ